MNRHHNTDFGYVYRMLAVAVAVALMIAMCGLCSRCVPL